MLLLPERPQNLLKKSLNRVLFIGTFLQRSTGTFDIEEILRQHFIKKGVDFRKVSHIKNKLLRLLHILWNIIVFPGKKVFFGVFSGQAFLITEIGTYLAKLLNKRIYFTLHGGALPEFAEKNKARIHKVFRRAHYIQSPSIFLKNYFEEIGYNVTHVPNPILLDNFPFKRNSVVPYSMLWVRAFTEIYNPDVAVKTLYHLKQRFPKATLTMVGPDKGMLAATQNLIAELGITESVQIVGSIPNDKLYSYYQSHEVYLNTTSYESFGKALIEAASCGVPIVSSSVGEIPILWTHEENMMLVENIDGEFYATEVEKLFSDKELADKLSKNARTKAEFYDWNNIEPAWTKLIMEV